MYPRTFPITCAALGALLVAMHAASALGAAPAAPTPSQQAGGQLSSADLDTLVAPIALYPDALVIQIVQCASSPFEVKQVDDWLKQHPELKGSAAQDAASKQGFDPSFVAIVLFPSVLDMMASKPEWTRDLGQAFTKDKNAFFASVQRLRSQAQAAGNLKTTAQQTVQTVSTDSGQQVIVIQPTNPQVVYVPQYNPTTVYTQAAPATVSSSSSQAAAAGLIGFAAGVIVGAAANDDDNYYYACGGWGYHGAALCSDGWNNYASYRQNMTNDYYDHRENMANDYYGYREDMADQRGQNQAQRQDTWSSNQTQRQDTRSSNQSERQDTRDDARSDRQSTWSEGQSSRQDQRSQNQSSRQSQRQSGADQWQSGAEQRQSSAQANRGGASSRGAFQNQSQGGSRWSGSSSGAFSGYQRGSSERESSSRGHSSMSRGGFSGGGGRHGRR